MTAKKKGLVELRSLARNHTERAIQVIAGVMDNGVSEKARITAADMLLDRGWGRPESTTTAKVTGADGVGPIIVEVIMRQRETPK